MDVIARRGAILAVLPGLLVSGCGGWQPAIGVPNAPQQSAALMPAPFYKVLYNFPVGGKFPEANLINVNGTLYGTTAGFIKHFGTVFSITTAGKEKVLHRFRGAGDGRFPLAGLIDVNGTLYGTTELGGATGFYGCIFTITTNGKEKVLYSFAGNGDGANPQANLIDVNGTLYGTTFDGGANEYGTVFSVTTAGSEQVLYSFSGGADGKYPAAGLVNVNGTLYGTTVAGGGSGCPSSSGCGTVFSVTTNGKENVLYRFAGGSDGWDPRASLIDVKGTLYGTTSAGGSACSGYGCGTVFSITPAGKESVIYNFRGGDDGAAPNASLIDVHGTFYGTTAYGGPNDDGTVFSLTPAGKEKVLHSFGKGSDGVAPIASLVNVKGTLYGTTFEGGNGCLRGCGTVFALTP